MPVLNKNTKKSKHIEDISLSLYLFLKYYEVVVILMTHFIFC